MPSLSTKLLGSSAALLALSRNATSQFDWNSITPSRDLHYVKCYDGLECARALMPLDWLEESVDRTVTLAVVKVPAKVQTSDHRYGGTVMANPGGPGASGVLHMLKNGRYIQDMVGSDELHFEILSFDPRGTGLSTPRADCYASETARQAAEWQSRGAGELDSLHIPTLKRALAKAKAHGHQCARYRDEEVDFNIHEFTATASTARDMLRLVDKTEELRQETVSRPTAMDSSQQQQPLDGKRKHSSGQGRLQYYGTSYGTVLGNTFLSMFPGRVKRMILDGVVIPEHWVLGNWDESMRDNHRAVDYLYQSCFQAGSSECALRKDSDHSWHEIQQRVQALIDRLDNDPAPGVTVGGPEIFIDGVAILELISGQVFSPLDFFEGLSSTLAQAVDGNYTELLEQLVPSLSDNDNDNNKEKHGDEDAVTALARPYTWFDDAFSSVACGDAENPGNYTLSHWKHVLERILARYPRLGVRAVDQTIKCAGWQSHPKDRFAGPFISPEADPKEVEGRPSAPLLLLSSLYDPVTPLASANVVARGHPGSSVLVQKSVGHCTLFSGPSRCLRRAVRAYMADGTMPQEGAVCGGDCVPFEECPHERGHL
ncbi:Dephospho-CoA kinase cab5 [Conoideocrella luteorostrata]|uniref:Dephospho-CoA kinase cab5 n=1 Tax=Conoideocrella luteorostrata TaxID=1105319 RepID=A0AAJ0FUY6_9HYPO|nr:Dephospho-CoA kinase cab5 [Conoideocrella luteorostrata]